MTRKALMLAGMMALVGLAGPAQAFKRGDWVLAQFKGSRYWFPAVVQGVQGVQGVQVDILYDDGDRETRPANQVKAYNWTVGTAVECNWKKGGDWYPGRITRLNVDQLSVAYDDGDKENTTTGLCRSK